LFDLPPIGQTKTKISWKNKIKLVFVWPTRGLNQNKFFVQGVNQKKYLQGGKTGNDLYFRGKDLLTLVFILCCEYSILILWTCFTVV